MLQLQLCGTRLFRSSGKHGKKTVEANIRSIHHVGNWMGTCRFSLFSCQTLVLLPVLPADHIWPAAVWSDSFEINYMPCRHYTISAVENINFHIMQLSPKDLHVNCQRGWSYAPVCIRSQPESRKWKSKIERERDASIKSTCSLVLGLSDAQFFNFMSWCWEMTQHRYQLQFTFYFYTVCAQVKDKHINYSASRPVDRQTELLLLLPAKATPGSISTFLTSEKVISHTGHWDLFMFHLDFDFDFNFFCLLARHSLKCRFSKVLLLLTSG